MSGQLRPRGVMMRDCSKSRAGFDRVLMAVAATFLTVSATARHSRRPIRPATAQPNWRSTRRSRAPSPPTSRLRPSTISSRTCQARRHRGGARSGKDNREGCGDQALRRRRSAGRRHRQAARPPRSKPAKTEPGKSEPAKKRHRQKRSGRHRAHPASGRGCRSAGRRARQGTDQGRAATCAPADQPVADRLRDIAGGEILALFRPQGRADRGGEILRRARLCPAVDPGRRADRRPAKASSRVSRMPPPTASTPPIIRCRISRRDHAGCACGSRSEADRQHARLCTPGPERPDALVAGQRRHPISGASDRSGGSAGECHDRQGRLRRARQLQPAAKALSRIEGEARRVARRWATDR